MVADNQDALAVFGEDIHIMADDEDSHALFIEIRQQGHELVLVFTVLTARRFVEDNVFRMHGNGRSDGNALLFPAVQVGRIGFRKFRQFRRSQSFVDSLADVVAAHAQLLRPISHFFADCRPEHLPFRPLEDVAYEMAAYRCIVVVDDLSVIENLPRYGLFQSHEQARHRRLAAAVAAAEADKFALTDFYIYMFQYGHAIAIVETDIFHFQHLSLPFCLKTTKTFRPYTGTKGSISSAVPPRLTQ